MNTRQKYGYKLVDGDLVEDKQKQSVIEMIIDLKAKFYSYNEIADELNFDNTPTPRGTKVWEKHNVQHIALQNKDKIEEKIQYRVKQVGATKDDGDHDLYGGIDPDTYWALMESPYDEVFKNPDGTYTVYCWDKVYKENLKEFKNVYRNKNIISESQAHELTDQYRRELIALDQMKETNRLKLVNEPFDYEIPIRGQSMAAHAAEKQLRDELEYWLDLMNTDGAKPASVKRKLRLYVRRALARLVALHDEHLINLQTISKLRMTVSKLEYEIEQFSHNAA